MSENDEIVMATTTIARTKINNRQECVDPMARCQGIKCGLLFVSEALKRTSPPSDLRGHKASNSSKNMTHGAEFRALWNTCLTARSLSPTY